MFPAFPWWIRSSVRRLYNSRLTPISQTVQQIFRIEGGNRYEYDQLHHWIWYSRCDWSRSMYLRRLCWQQVRTALYVSVLQVLIYYVIANHSNSKFAVWQVSLGGIALHLFNFYFVFVGQLDQYTLMITIHLSLLLNGPQLIHLFKFQRRSWHRWYFVTNTICTLAEFLLSCLRPAWINRNGNFCPELNNAMEATQVERLNWTIFLLVLNIGLSLCDVLVSATDRLRNKDKKPGERSRPTIPRFVTWDKNVWSSRRVVYCVVGYLLLFLSICNLEVAIIRHFHESVRHVDALSSAENGWGAYGQMIPAFSAIVPFFVNLRTYLISVTYTYAKKTKGMPHWVE